MKRDQLKVPLNRLFSLKNRVILLTGATGHLGVKMAWGLTEAGASVILNARNATKLESLEKALHAKERLVSIAGFDITDDQASKAGINQIRDKYGRLDCIINNAYSGRGGILENATAADFESSYKLNVIAPFRIIQHAMDLLVDAGLRNPGGASIVNISSMYGTVSPDPMIYGDSGENNPPFYGAAKAGMIQLSRYLACHLAKDKIRVNSISPGPFPAASAAQQNLAFFTKLHDKTPMNRIGRPEELAGPVVFLASDASSYVTGINLPVDGGWTAW